MIQAGTLLNTSLGYFSWFIAFLLGSNYSNMNLGYWLSLAVRPSSPNIFRHRATLNAGYQTLYHL